MIFPQVRKLRLRNFVGPGEYGHVSRQRLTRRLPTLPHVHDFAELFWVNAGEGIHTANGIEAPLLQGQVWFVRPEDVHGLRVFENQSLEITNIAFPTATLVWLETQYSGTGKTFWWGRLRKAATQVDAGRLRVLNQLADRLAAAPRDRLSMEHFLISVLVELRNPGLDVALQGAPDWLLAACRRMLEPEHLRGGVRSLFELAGRSPEHVSRTMRAKMGETPSDYVNRLRIGQATFLLRMTSLSVSEIAFEVGYENLSHFFHLFRRIEGTSPQRYRQRIVLEPQNGFTN